MSDSAIWTIIIGGIPALIYVGYYFGNRDRQNKIINPVPSSQNSVNNKSIDEMQNDTLTKDKIQSIKH